MRKQRITSSGSAPRRQPPAPRTFTSLDDTADSYVGSAGKSPVVNPGETALVFGGPFIPTSEKGVANGVATLDASSKLTASQIPDITVSDYLGAVASQAAMLALVGQRGDWCTRTDTGTNFIVIAEPSSLLASWRELSYPTAPVTSVNSQTGAVVIPTVEAITEPGGVATNCDYYYGTGNPPAAGSLPSGTLFYKYIP